MFSATPIFFLLFPLLHAQIQPQICYSSSGNEDPGAIVCDPSAEDSGCCSPGDICFSNGLCQPGPEQPVKGVTDWYYDACTNSNWNTTACASACLATVGNGMQSCGTLNTYCCYGFDGCDCGDAAQVVSLPAGTIITTIPMTASTIVASSSSASLSTSVTTTQSVDATTSTSSPVSTASSAASTATSSASSSSGLSQGATIGIGVGVGVGAAILLAAVAGFFVMRRRKGTVEAGNPGNTEYGSRSELPADSTTKYSAIPQRSELPQDGSGHEQKPSELDIRP